VAAAHAALAQNEALICDMEQALDVMRAEISNDTVDVINIRRADIDFHIAIANSSPNVVLKDLIETVASAIGLYWLIWMKMGFKQRKEIAEDTLRERNLILAAIKEGHAIAAETAMQNHFQTHFERSRKLFGAKLRRPRTRKDRQAKSRVSMVFWSDPTLSFWRTGIGGGGPPQVRAYRKCRQFNDPPERSKACKFCARLFRGARP
jgi:hypothetical protein